MPRIIIDNARVEVPQGRTILDAVRKLGVDIPTLCYAEGYRPPTACMLCLVKLKNGNRLVPSCATVAEDGMQVECETEELHRLRRTGLELLLSDHLGDCSAPCENTCPTHMDIPLMLRQVAAGDLAAAIVTIKRDMALPAVLGRVCPDLCERGCRRREMDNPAAICLVKQHVADVDLATDSPYLPPCKPDTGKGVAIVGAGPTGLSAAYHLQQAGHACTLFDEREQPGGMLRYDFDVEQLPRSVLDAEIAVIQRLGVVFLLGTKIGRDRSLASLTEDFDAVLVAAGPLDEAAADRLGVLVAAGRLDINAQTHETSLPGVFAAGDVVHPTKFVVRAVADGKSAAACIDQFLSGVEVTGLPKVFNVRVGRLTEEEIARMAIGVSPEDRVTPLDSPGGGLTETEARGEALRCLHCDCGRKSQCRLRRYAQLYGARPKRYQGTRRAFERDLQSVGDEAAIVFEPGKCILCGLCVQIATEACEPLGLTFVGRGFDTRIGVPFDRSMAEGLTVAARRCVEVCPTGALILREGGLEGVGLAGSCDPQCGRTALPDSVSL